jgi:hypothetical protein
MELVAKMFPKGDRSYTDAALRSACKIVGGAAVGERNSVLFNQACGIGELVAGGGLDRETAGGRLLAAAVTNKIPTEEARATVESGFETGAKNPRKVTTTGE